MTPKPVVEPYDFVPLVGSPQRREPVWHHQYRAKSGTYYSGRLTCRLTAQTPLFVYHPDFARRMNYGHERVSFPVFDGQAMIPGTSLKGVLRTMVEMIVPSCLTLPTDWYHRTRTYRGHGVTRGQSLKVRVPHGFEHCHTRKGDRPAALCPACRLFGSLDPNGRWAYAGNVSVGDATAGPEEYTLGDYVTLDVLSAPKPEGRPEAYTQHDGQTIKGRKLYRHRYPPDVLERAKGRGGRPKRDNQNKTVQPVEPGSVFTFEVPYANVAEDDLRALLYAVVLEEGLWHKVGMGKPIGLGSAKIEVIGWQRLNRQARYRRLGGGTESLEGDRLQQAVDRWVKPYRQQEDPALSALRDILRPDPSVDVRYDTGW